MIEIVLASRNKNKIAEFQVLLNSAFEGKIKVLSLDDIGFHGEIIENGETFEENAFTKASVPATLGYIGFADDSGLCVDALDGAPGVYSARFSGGSDEDNNDLLLEKLSRSEKIQIKEQIALHKRLEGMIASGNFYRLESPFENDYCSWQIVSSNKKSSFVMVASQKLSPNMFGHYVKLQGLIPDKIYNVNPISLKLSGKTLMNFGLPITQMRDFETLTFELKAE